jgi:hypothetical protein
MICLTSLASESAIGASAIRLEYKEIVGSRYCPDGRFGWLAPIAGWPPDTRPLTLANLPRRPRDRRQVVLAQVFLPVRSSLKSGCRIRQLVRAPIGREIRGWAEGVICRICISMRGRLLIWVHTDT